HVWQSAAPGSACKTGHPVFCGRYRFPPEALVRGVALTLVCVRVHENARPVRTLRQAKAVVLRPVSRRGPGTATGIRDNCPVSALVDEPGGSPEARFACQHDGLISMFDANLVEDPGYIITDRFLRQAKRSGDLRVAEAF